MKTVSVPGHTVAFAVYLIAVIAIYAVLSLGGAG